MSESMKVNVYGTSIYTLINVDAGGHSVNPDMFDTIFTPEYWNPSANDWVKGIGVYTSPDVAIKMSWPGPNISGDILTLTICEADIAHYTLKRYTAKFSEYTITNEGAALLCSANFETESLPLDDPDNRKFYNAMIREWETTFKSQKTKEEISDAQ